MIYTTGHPIADHIAKFLPDGDYGIGYGILRGMAEKLRSHKHWFEIDRGFWDANHFDGNYRISYKGTQPMYDPLFPSEAIAMEFVPWKTQGYTLICPPTDPVCEFFDIDWMDWVSRMGGQYGGIVRHKGTEAPVDWDNVGRVVTFNSSIAVEALKRGIPVISDSDHSTVGSWNKSVDAGDRHKLFSFMQAHHFKLVNQGDICRTIQHYLSTST